MGTNVEELKKAFDEFVALGNKHISGCVKFQEETKNSQRLKKKWKWLQEINLISGIIASVSVVVGTIVYINRG